MAKDKKKIIFYVNWAKLFKKLTVEEAGNLIQHFSRYVTDENPKAPDRITDLLFSEIKDTLKRDLKGWEEKSKINSNNGRLGGRPKKTEEKPNKANGLNINPKKGDTDIDTDKVIDIVIDKDKYKTILLSEIEISDFPNLNNNYLEITLAFYELFKNNLKEAGASTKNIEKAKGTWIDDIRKIFEIDKYTKNDLLDIYQFLQQNSFWKKNIISTSKLREQMDKLKLQIKNNGTHKQTNENRDINELTAIIEKHSRNIEQRNKS